MEIKLNKYTTEDHDVYKKLQDTIEEKGKKV